MLGFAAVSEVALGALPEEAAPPPSRITISAATRARWSASADRHATVQARHDVTGHTDERRTAPWGVGDRQDVHDAATWSVSGREDAARAAPWGIYLVRPQPVRLSPWRRSAASDEAACAPWGRYEGRAEPRHRDPWHASRPSDERRGAPWAGPMLVVDFGRRAAIAKSAPADRVRWVPWTKFSRAITGDWGVVIPVHTGDPEALYIVPVRSVYMQINEATLTRIDGDIELPVTSMSLSLDRDSWVWSFSASMPATALPDVEPNEDGDPVELEAVINGVTFRVLAERITRERTFGGRTIQVVGRGKAALLDAPYAAVQNFGNSGARTLQQIMGDVLTVAGVPLDWDLTFGPEDWLVPANTFAHRGTYISALNQLAAAAGAYIQPHTSEQELFVLPQYPVAPWEWGTVEPDFELPSALMTREGIEWVDKPLYNRVYVSGAQNGVLGRVTRAGSAGDLVAPTIVDPLISVAAAARQRGLPVLANTGRIANTTLRFPILTETSAGGIVVPGKFVRYVDGATTRFGLGRSISISASREKSLQVWQTVMVETHV